jgi:hypothetical protein
MVPTLLGPNRRMMINGNKTTNLFPITDIYGRSKEALDAYNDPAFTASFTLGTVRLPTLLYHRHC